jgi:hypothetical protein
MRKNDLTARVREGLNQAFGLRALPALVNALKCDEDPFFISDFGFGIWD